MKKIALNRDFAIGAQPTQPDLATLQKEGFRSVINLRTPEESSPLSPEKEGAEVRALGMEYQHLPVSSQNLSQTQADQFSAKFRDLPKPVYVHCQGGTRAGAFAVLHLGRERGVSAEEAFAEAEKAGYKCESAALRDFVIAQLDGSGGSTSTRD